MLASAKPASGGISRTNRLRQGSEDPLRLAISPNTGSWSNRPTVV
uniref:Protein of unassigned function n=1 Tax=Macrostomum lignano TaxID=282301 RepID=A0A1I8F9S5_9PLAT